jgi:hypothetical protein
MVMKQPHEPEAGAPGKLPAEAAPKKAYHRPVLRVLGVLHLMTRGTGTTANGDAGQMMMI